MPIGSLLWNQCWIPSYFREDPRLGTHMNPNKQIPTTSDNNLPQTQLTMKTIAEGYFSTFLLSSHEYHSLKRLLHKLNTYASVMKL